MSAVPAKNIILTSIASHPEEDATRSREMIHVDLRSRN